MKVKDKKTGFTIIEILTVMSIIVILISLLVPALSQVRRYARVVTQKGQFDTITKGLEMFRNAHDDEYPDSGPFRDPNGDYYCGAMRLCEAMMGQDGMGFHPDSRFLAEGGTDAAGNPLYPFDLCVETTSLEIAADSTLISSIRMREKYIDTDKVKAYKLQDVFSRGITPFDEKYPNAVISDVFLRTPLVDACLDRLSEKVGMPVLYYKADISKLYHTAEDAAFTDWPLNNIYNWEDNFYLTELGLPWEDPKTTEHPLYDDGGGGATKGSVFYKITKNPKSTATPRPHNEGSYILMSAGWDGLYGTRDDIFNFTP